MEETGKTLEMLKVYQEAYIELLMSYNEHLKWTVWFLADLAKTQNMAIIKGNVQCR